MHLKEYKIPFKNYSEVESSGVEDEQAYIQNMNDPYGRQME